MLVTAKDMPTQKIDQFATHMDVNAVIFSDEDVAKSIQHKAADNMKRVVARAGTKWASESAQNPYLIKDTQEVKTTWHPIGS